MSSIDGGDRPFSQPRREPTITEFDAAALTLDEIEQHAIDRGDVMQLALVGHLRRVEKKIDGWLEAERFRASDHR